MIRRVIVDVLIGFGLAALVAILLLFSAADTTFIYRGF
jgi:hypothetical protein